jgi:hypothetical protein
MTHKLSELLCSQPPARMVRLLVPPWGFSEQPARTRFESCPSRVQRECALARSICESAWYSLEKARADECRIRKSLLRAIATGFMLDSDSSAALVISSADLVNVSEGEFLFMTQLMDQGSWANAPHAPNLAKCPPAVIPARHRRRERAQPPRLPLIRPRPMLLWRVW